MNKVKNAKILIKAQPEVLSSVFAQLNQGKKPVLTSVEERYIVRCGTDVSTFLNLLPKPSKKRKELKDD